MSREQDLVDVCFQIGLMIHDHESFKRMSIEETANWITKQLKDSGFPTHPVGSSWGVLENE